MATVFKKISWTDHSQVKMRQYGLSKIKLLQILRKPERKEIGIAPGTLAVMRTNPVRNSARYKQAISNGASKKISKWKMPKKAPGEIWIMFKDKKGERKIISAWRYPGVTKPGEAIPIPLDIRDEILNSNI